MSSANEKVVNKDELKGIPTESFNIHLLYDSFVKCVEDVDALAMDHYLVGFKELYRFFMLLGSVFGFVASDIISKVTILEEYRHSENGHQYATIQSMIEYENCNGIASDISRPSGSRTLLRLHRSLEFVMSFMRDFSTADSNAKSSIIAQKCYRDTLSRHHPWLIQKGAHLAMYTLPARQQFIERVYGGPCNVETVQLYEKMMGDIADVSKKVYEETNKLYEANSFLNLP